MTTLKQLQTVLLEVRRDFLRGSRPPITPRQINNGWCADFATIVWETLGCPLDVHFYSDEDLGAEKYSHTFLEFNGLYFDSQCIEGVDDWTQLPIFLEEEWVGCCDRCGKIVAEHYTEEGQFCEGCLRKLEAECAAS